MTANSTKLKRLPLPGTDMKVAANGPNDQFGPHGPVFGAEDSDGEHAGYWRDKRKATGAAGKGGTVYVLDPPDHIVTEDDLSGIN